MASQPPAIRRRLAEERLEDCRRGVPGAAERLVAEYGPLVLAIARRSGLGEEDVEEVFQETWASLFGQIDDIRRPGALVAWIQSTARRQVWFVRRRRARAGGVDPEDEPEAQLADPQELTAKLEHAQLVHEGLAELAPRCRDLLRAAFFERLAYEAIAARLGMALGSVGPTRQRCLSELAALLERKGLS